jgi:hypothetical protein
MAVAIQPAGSPASRKHYLDTVENLVKISLYEELIGTDLVSLQKISKNGATALWGVTPGKNNANVSKYKKMSVGDIVIFTRDKTAFASAEITYLFRNKLLAENLWGKDNKNQTWEYMYALDNIEKLDLTYRDLQKAIHSKTGDNFMGFRVLDRQKSHGALELLGKPVEQSAWDIKIGDELKRTELQKTYGGAPYGGIEPSAKTPNILIFTNPYKKSNYGYNFDEELEDGTFTYTGDGLEDDQKPNTGGNKAILEHRETRRSLRVFEATKKQTFVRYLGEFELGSPEYSVRKAPDVNGKDRDVLVFNLNPVGVTKSIGKLDKEPSIGGVKRKTSEKSQNEVHVRKPSNQETFAERKEIQLQDRYKSYINSLGQEIETIEIEIPGQGSILKPDLVNFTTKEVIEVKSGVSRKYVREAIGQVLDYVFQIEKIEKQIYKPVILVPGPLSSDLSDLLAHLEISLVFENSSGNFEQINN